MYNGKTNHLNKDVPIKVKRKILIFDPISRAGGGISYLLNAIPFFSKSDSFQFVFFCNRSLQSILDQMFPDAAIIYSSKLAAKGGIFAFFDRILFTRRTLKTIDPDIIIYMNQIPVKSNIPSVLFLRNALYYITKDTEYKGPLNTYLRVYCWFFRQITHRHLKKSDAVITATKTFSQIISKYHKHVKNSIVAPFGINSVVSDSQSNRFSNTQIQILFLQYNIYKGLETAVKAIKVLSDKNYSVRLIVTDDINRYNDPVACNIQQYIATNNLQDSILIVGPKKHSDLSYLYQSSDIFVFPSYVESFGHGLIEAMANGLPCVVSDLQVFHELADTAVSYFSPGDPFDLAEKIIRIINDSELQKIMSEKSIQKAREYSWKRHVNSIEQLLNEMS